MLGDIWSSSELTAEQLGITEIKLSFLRENGILKPGIHWKSSPLGQKKPWNPKALYNIKMCSKINKFYFDEKKKEHMMLFLRMDYQSYQRFKMKKKL